MASAELLAALLDTETALGVQAFAAGVEGDARLSRLPSPAAAVTAASEAARRGKRATVLLGASEVTAAASAVAAAVRERDSLVVHVLGSAMSPTVGREDLAHVLDLGAGVLVTWSDQDAVDVAIAVRRAGEDSETPFIHVVDAPPGANDAPIERMDAAAALRFVGASPAERPAGLLSAADVARKRAERGFAARVPFALSAALRELSELTRRPLGAIERFETADAEEVVVAVGSAFPAARETAKRLRSEGKRAGVLGVRAVRPFFAVEAVKALSRARAIGVIEPLDVALAPCGPFAQSLKAAFADAITWAPGFPGVGHVPPIVSAVFATLDGGISPQDVGAVFAEVGARDRARRLLVFGSDGA